MLPFAMFWNLACVAEDGAGDSEIIEEDTGEFVAPEPEWTAQDAFDRLSLVSEIPLAGTILSTYRAALAQGDAACPGSDTQLAGEAMSGCTAESGVTYSGVADYAEAEWDDGSGVWAFTSLGADFEITFADGAVFAGGGSVGAGSETPYSAVPIWHSRVQGTWLDEASEGPMMEGISSFLDVSGTSDGSSLVLDGGIALSDLTFRFANVIFSADCGALPTGVVWVRDPDGYWFELDFGATCAPCGEVSFNGGASGEACVDLSPLVDSIWAELPS